MGDANGLCLLTVNLWGDNGPVGQRLADLATYLRDSRPDVVALQEVTGAGGATQAHRLADEAGYAHVEVAWSGRRNRRGEGLAVISQLDARQVGMLTLPGSRLDHPRGAQLVDVVTSAGPVVRVANTHLAWRLGATRVRVCQAEAIRDELAGWSGAAVVAGDLNDVPGSRPLEVLVEAGFEDALVASGASERPTFDHANPFLWQPELADRRVDHVLVRGLRVAEAAVVLTGEDAPIVSDHFGVRARVLAGP